MKDDKRYDIDCMVSEGELMAHAMSVRNRQYNPFDEGRINMYEEWKNNWQDIAELMRKEKAAADEKMEERRRIVIKYINRNKK